MTRYIEIIFDDSGSMNATLNGEQKHLIAKRLFKEKILPALGKKGDSIVLRTLSNSCSFKSSFAKKLPNNLVGMMQVIDAIRCEKGTPLYFTIKDSIEACKVAVAKEKHIFILTDGDDTCNIPFENIIDDDFLAIKDQLNLNSILVQFAVDDPLSQNNLTAFTQKIKATSVVITSGDLKDFNLVGSKLIKAFHKTGLSTANGFPHCFDEIDGISLPLELLSYTQGFDFYLVELLHKEGLLSWKPSKTKNITPTQQAELLFLYSLRFRNNLPESLVKQMLSTLQKPYKYSFDCIYWDFKDRVWKYFTEVSEVQILPNPDAKFADRGNTREIDYLVTNYPKKANQDYFSDELYEVVSNNESIANESFQLIKKQNYSDFLPFFTTLREGDYVRFEGK